MDQQDVWGLSRQAQPTVPCLNIKIYNCACDVVFTHTYVLLRTRVVPTVPVLPERTKPVTHLPPPVSETIYDVHAFEPHRGQLM